MLHFVWMHIKKEQSDTADLCKQQGNTIVCPTPGWTQGRSRAAKHGHMEPAVITEGLASCNPLSSTETQNTPPNGFLKYSFLSVNSWKGNNWPVAIYQKAGDVWIPHPVCSHLCYCPVRQKRLRTCMYRLRSSDVWLRLDTEKWNRSEMSVFQTISLCLEFHVDRHHHSLEEILIPAARTSVLKHYNYQSCHKSFPRHFHSLFYLTILNTTVGSPHRPTISFSSFSVMFVFSVFYWINSNSTRPR